MRRIASSVAVITTAYDGHLHGMTATAVTSVSAEPPRLLIVVNRSTRSHPLITASRIFVVNILADSQRGLGEHFARSGDNQFEGIAYDLGPSGSPIVREAAAHLECTLVSETDMGTHTIFVGQVVGGGVSGSNPLLYHDGAYKAVTPRVSQHAIAPFFVERWSPRAFTDATIDDTELMRFFEAAHWAPSSMNAQPWRFVYVRRGDEGWTETLGCLSNTNQSWAFRASALVAFVSKETMEFNGKTVPSPTHSFDTGAAWMSFALQAYLAGWYAHGMAGFNHAGCGRFLPCRTATPSTPSRRSASSATARSSPTPSRPARSPPTASRSRPWCSRAGCRSGTLDALFPVIWCSSPRRGPRREANIHPILATCRKAGSRQPFQPFRHAVRHGKGVEPYG